MPPWREQLVRYLHVETDPPALLSVAGISLESYRDRGDRNAFSNVATWEPVPVPVPAPAEVPAPPAPQPPAATAPDPEPPRPAAVPEPDAAEWTTDPGIHLRLGDAAIFPHKVDDDRYVFAVPARTPEIRIASRSVVPAELDPDQQDRRRLGIGVRAIRIRTATLDIEIGPEEESLDEGFYTREPGLRWTDGLALVPPRFYRWIADPCEVELHVLKTPLRYPPGAPTPERLPTPAPAAARPAARAGQPRALFIDACTPTPDRDAGSNVALWHMRLLQDLGYHVTFVPQDNFTAIPGYTPALHALGIDTVELPAYSDMESFLRDHGAAFALAYVHRFAVAEACLPLLRRHAPGAPILFNNADLHYLRLERAASLGGDAAGLRAAAAVKRRELAVIAAADVTILCNTAERDLVAAELPAARLAMLPWVIAPRTDPAPGHAERRDIMFLGGFGHPPNVDAVLWFVASVLPILKRLSPDLRLHVYGAAIPPEIEALASEWVVIGGHVIDLRPVLDRHIAMVAPLRFGAGFKGKIAEALAAGLPVVASPVAAEGTGLVAGEHLLLAETAPSMAMALARLESDAALWERLAVAGHRFAGDHLSPERGRATLAAILAMVGRPAAAGVSPA
jgi:glycosyltransferase involved in cell wall biosynthesis